MKLYDLLTSMRKGNPDKKVALKIVPAEYAGITMVPLNDGIELKGTTTQIVLDVPESGYAFREIQTIDIDGDNITVLVPRMSAKTLASALAEYKPTDADTAVAFDKVVEWLKKGGV